MLLLPGERSVFDLNAEMEQQLGSEAAEFWEKTPKADALAAVREDGWRPAAGRDFRRPRWSRRDASIATDYHIDKFVLHTDSGVPLPGLTYHPAKPGRDAYLYLHEGGKTADGAPGGPIEKLVKDRLRRRGHRSARHRRNGVAAGPNALFGDSKSYFLAYLLGQSLVGLHTEDALAAAHFVANYKTKTPRKVHLIGVGRAACAGPARCGAGAGPVRLRHAAAHARVLVAPRGTIGSGRPADQYRARRTASLRLA